MELIRVEGIAKSYGKHQVHKDLTLSLSGASVLPCWGRPAAVKLCCLGLLQGLRLPMLGEYPLIIL